MRTTSTRVDHAVPRTLQPEAPSEGELGATVNFVDRFLFSPVDPTTLGVIRFCTGIVVLYMHLVYTAQLQEFFGRDAWLDLTTANAYRNQAPTLAPYNGWIDDSGKQEIPGLDEAKTEQERDQILANRQKYIDRWNVAPEYAI